MRVFPLTKMAIEHEILSVEEQLQKASRDKRDSGHTTDGDMMDDPLMHQQMEQIGMLQLRLSRLKDTLSSLKLLDEDEVFSSTAIQLGHRVKVKVRYADGDSEEYYATIGSTLDQQFIGKNKTYFNGSTELMLSDESAIVQSLLGKAVGDKVIYVAPGGTNRVHIISLEPSPLPSVPE